MSAPAARRPCLTAAHAVLPTPTYGSTTRSPGAVSARTNRSTSSTGNWHGWIVFSTWLAFTLGKIHRSPGFFPRGCPVYWPAFFPFQALLPGYFWRTRTGSRSNRYASPLVNHKTTSYRPEKRFEQCSPCSKCQTQRHSFGLALYPRRPATPSSPEHAEPAEEHRAPFPHRLEHVGQLVSGVVHHQLPPGPRAHEVLDRRERHRLVVAASVDERRRRRIGLLRVAARVVEQVDRERDLAPESVVMDGRRALLAPA